MGQSTFCLNIYWAMKFLNDVIAPSNWSLKMNLLSNLTELVFFILYETLMEKFTKYTPCIPTYCYGIGSLKIKLIVGWKINIIYFKCWLNLFYITIYTTSYTNIYLKGGKCIRVSWSNIDFRLPRACFWPTFYSAHLVRSQSLAWLSSFSYFAGTHFALHAE